ncbi:MAG: hypothetical protein H6Q10_3165, partial [Acidobacteria bacterium]|nr:hypothetical protein [Acidobacteriota bacterium]
MGIVRRRSARVMGLALALLAGAAADAKAQTFGIGARMVSVSGPESPAATDGDSSRTRLWGGFARLHVAGSFG